MVRFVHFLVCAPMVMVRSLRGDGPGAGGVHPSAAAALLHVTAEQVANDSEPAPPMPPAWQGLLGPGRSVGAGNFGWVYLHGLTGCPGTVATVALKALKSKACHNKGVIRGEVRALLGVRHPNVMRMYDFSPRDPKTWCKLIDGEQHAPMFLLEPARGGEVMSVSNRYRKGKNKKGRRSAKLRLVMMLLVDVLRGLDAMHSAGYIHRDIKPDNIFEMTGDSSCVESLGCEFVIGDLGFATQGDMVDGQRMPYTESLSGTLAFLPPETNPHAWPGLRKVLSASKNRWYFAGDVWALGISALVLLLNYDAATVQLYYSVAGLRLLRLNVQTKSYLPRALLDLLLHMTSEDFKARPSAAEASARAEQLFRELYGFPRPLRTAPEPECLRKLADWSSTWPEPL